MLKPCIGNSPQRCAALIARGSRCPSCERKRNARRGTTSQRGYGTEHQRARRLIEASLPAPCGYCGQVIYPGERWDAAHVRDGDPSQGLMPAHPTCNQRARGRTA